MSEIKCCHCGSIIIKPLPNQIFCMDGECKRIRMNKKMRDYRDSDKYKEWRLKNKEILSDRNKERYKLKKEYILDRNKHPHVKMLRRKSTLNRLYNLSIIQVEELKCIQNNICPICLNPLDGKYHVDHNHNTGVVRGLLHPICNTNLGRIEPFIENKRITHLEIYINSNPLNQKNELRNRHIS